MQLLRDWQETSTKDDVTQSAIVTRRRYIERGVLRIHKPAGKRQVLGSGMTEQQRHSPLENGVVRFGDSDDRAAISQMSRPISGRASRFSDESTRTLPTHDDAIAFEVIESPTYRSLGRPEVPYQFDAGRDEVARLQVPAQFPQVVQNLRLSCSLTNSRRVYPLARP